MRYLNCVVLLLFNIPALLTSHAVPGVTVGLRPEHFHPVQSLYHSQDQFGQYVYGYATPTSSKSETKTADGVTTGGYSYIDTSGKLQTVHYTADATHGFRVAASNLPQDLPDVAYAKAAHLANYEAVKAEHQEIAAVRAVPYSNPVAVPFSGLPHVLLQQQVVQPVTDLPEVAQARAAHLAALESAYVGHLNSALPQPVQDLPEVAKARAEHLAAVDATITRDAALRAEISLSPIPEQISGNVVPVHTIQADDAIAVAPAARVSYAPAVVHGPVSSQQEIRHDWGQYSYGYVGPFSAQSETRTADGVVNGGYSYIDANGIVQTVQYIADKAGFRVAATNLPVDQNHLALKSPSHPVAAVPVVH